LAAISAIANASGQKASGSSSGAKFSMATLDTDHDGTISKPELTAFMEGEFDKADTDHDGTLDKNEIEELRKGLGIPAGSAQKTSSGASSGPKLTMTGLDKDNDGTVSKDEFTAYMEAQFEKADGDHDGTLDKEEFQQLRKNLGIGKK
jgi:Ca2+-binding EF-hand superfamily protein